MDTAEQVYISSLALLKVGNVDMGRQIIGNQQCDKFLILVNSFSHFSVHESMKYREYSLPTLFWEFRIILDVTGLLTILTCLKQALISTGILLNMIG